MSRYYCVNKRKCEERGVMNFGIVSGKALGWCLKIRDGQGCKHLKINPKVLKHRRRNGR
jgi:hypothetical protein